jgi:sulfotransferase family protein
VNPFLFVVGCARSGTRMLGRLLDGHPELAVIHEARFVPGWFKHRRGVTPDGHATRELVERLAAFERFDRLGVARADLERLLGPGGTVPYAEFVSRLFDLVGRARGKPLVADKSPRYARNIPTLHELFPRAKILHLVRDGRDVALSVASWRKVTERGDLVARYDTWREDPVSTIALWWEREVRLGREDGRALGPELYGETHYEALVADPPGECARLCAFLGVPYDDAMVASTATRPPTPGMRDWRRQMPPADVRRFEASAGELLHELDYPRAFPDITPEERDHAARMRARLSEQIRAGDGRVPRAWASSVPA